MWSRGLNRTLCAVVLAGAAVMPGAAQPAAPQAGPKPEALAGLYEGTAVGPDGGAMTLRVELKYESGRFAGYVDAQVAQVSIVGGGLQGDTLVLTIDSGGMAGQMRGKVAEGRIEGTWTLGDMAGTYAVAKLETPPDAAGDQDPISGAWAGEVYVQGQAMPFSLTLRLDGETVTGDIESAMGKVPLAGGGWSNGTLTITFPYVGGEPVSMGAQLRDGRLEGIVDYNTGELQGTWVASRK